MSSTVGSAYPIYEWKILDHDSVAAKEAEAYSAGRSDLGKISYPFLLLDRRTARVNLEGGSKDPERELKRDIQPHEWSSDDPNIVTSDVTRGPGSSLCLPIYDLDWLVTPSVFGTLEMHLPVPIATRDRDDFQYLLDETGIIQPGDDFKWKDSNIIEVTLGHRAALVPSTENWHLYSNIMTETRQYLYWLEALAEFGVLDEFWVKRCLLNRYGCLRLPHVKKELGPFDPVPLPQTLAQANNPISFASGGIISGSQSSVATITAGEIKAGGITASANPPSSPTSGSMYFNTTDEQIYAYMGNHWVIVTTSPPPDNLPF